MRCSDGSYEADDERALRRPEGVAREHLARFPQAEVIEVEAEVKDRHPYDGHTAQGVQAVETLRRGGVQSVFS